MLSTLIAALLALSPLASAHSWVEEYQAISENGSYTGAPGYSRGYVSRTDPTFNGFSLMWMLPSLEARKDDGSVRNRINGSDLLCHPAQRTANQTSGFPKLKVSPGDYVAMKYLENGHTTLPWNVTGKPPASGTVFVFGTTQPSNTEKIADVMEWNKAGTGGNKKGWLMTAQNFDDGRCHQINCGSISQERQMLMPNHAAGQTTSTVESWCETDLKIPKDVKAGTLTTYWVWQWPTEPNGDCNTPYGKDEYYTTCADFDIVEQAKMKQAVPTADASSSTIPPANPQSVAVSDYKSRTAYTSVASASLQNDKRAATTTSVNTAFLSSCSVQARVISANNLGLWPEVYVPNTCTVISTFGSAAASVGMKAFNSEAASYTSGSKSAWSAAFAAAKLPIPSRTPWSAWTNAAPTAQATAPPTGYAGTTFSAGGGQVTTITTVVVITSTLPPGEPIPSAASSPVAYSSASSAASSPAAYSSSSSSAASSAAAYSTPASSSSVPAGFIPTISTVGGSAPTGSTPVVPSVAANGTVVRLRNRHHPRHLRSL